MKRNAKQVKRGRTTPQANTSYEVVYVNSSLQRAATLPKPEAKIAYVRQVGGAYLVPRAGKWIEVSQEAALQRAEGLRRRGGAV